MLLLAFIFLAVAYTVAEDPVVTLPSGQIRGVLNTTPREGKPFYAFLGVPFAAPPIGKLRFQPPQPVEHWEGILEAKSNDKVCYQIGKNMAAETEDCLYINIYSPVEPGSNATLPVIVSIYGGGFTHGYAERGYLRPAYLLEKDLVVVTFNYRLGPFGFLSTGDRVIPGNMGLKDQLLALKWVQQNIHSFGGDPKKVTILGQSAGAASVTYHILSEKSAGLFRAAIASSGSALCNWAQQKHPVETAFGIAAEINPEFDQNSTSEELLEFLQNVDAKAIDDTDDKYYAYAPVLEIEHDGAFITESMYELVSNGKINKVPLLIGINSEEDLAKAADLESFKKNFVVGYDKYLYLLADDDMRIQDVNVRTKAGEVIRRIYTEGLLQDNLAGAIQYVSDNNFVRAVIKYAELQAKYTDVYFYQFSYHGLLGNNNISMDGLGRVQHGEDTRYLWAYTENLDSYPEADIKTVDRYVGFFANFVKTLNPTPEPTELNQNLIWPTVRQNDFSYMDIDEDLLIKLNPRNFSYGKWVDIFETYGVKPFTSY